MEIYVQGVENLRIHLITQRIHRIYYAQGRWKHLETRLSAWATVEPVFAWKLT